MFENRALRIFGPTREEVAGDRVIKSRRMRWVGQVDRMGQMRIIYSVLVGKTEGKRPRGRKRHR